MGEIAANYYKTDMVIGIRILLWSVKWFGENYGFLWNMPGYWDGEGVYFGVSNSYKEGQLLLNMKSELVVVGRIVRERVGLTVGCEVIVPVEVTAYFGIQHGLRYYFYPSLLLFLFAQTVSQT